MTKHNSKLTVNVVDWNISDQLRSFSAVILWEHQIFPVQNKPVSSAKLIMPPLVANKNRAFIHKLKSSGLSIAPFRTPHFTSFGLPT